MHVQVIKGKSVPYFSKPIGKTASRGNPSFTDIFSSLNNHTRQTDSTSVKDKKTNSDNIHSRMTKDRSLSFNSRSDELSSQQKYRTEKLASISANASSEAEVQDEISPVLEEFQYILYEIFNHKLFDGHESVPFSHEEIQAWIQSLGNEGNWNEVKSLLLTIQSWAQRIFSGYDGTSQSVPGNGWHRQIDHNSWQNLQASQAVDQKAVEEFLKIVQNMQNTETRQAILQEVFSRMSQQDQNVNSFPLQQTNEQILSVQNQSSGGKNANMTNMESTQEQWILENDSVQKPGTETQIKQDTNPGVTSKNMQKLQIGLLQTGIPFSLTTGNSADAQTVSKRPMTFTQFVQQFHLILKRANFVNNGLTQRLTVQLHPENLGTLHIQLVKHQGELVAKILSTSKQAKEMLEAHIHTLRQAFNKQNIPINRLDLENILLAEEQEYEKNGQNGQNRKNQDEGRRREKNESSEVAKTAFQELLVNFEI